MKSKLLYSVLLFMSTFVLFAQGEHFVCGFEEDPNEPVYFSPFNNPSFSGSVDPAYLASFEPISFNIFFWGINNGNGFSSNPLDSAKVEEMMKYVNDAYRPYNICFVLKGIKYINDDYLYISPYLSSIKAYADANGYVETNSFNVYVPLSYIEPMSGQGDYHRTSLTVHSYTFSEWNPANLIHELGHNFNLSHTHLSWSTTPCEHVTREISHSDYNASHLGTNPHPMGDRVHDTNAVPNFRSEVPGTLFANIDSVTCLYTGNGTDCKGTSYEISEQDVRNYMSYSPAACQNQFTIGQGIRMRETIQQDYYGELAQAMIPTSIDLYIKDNPEDFGEQPNITSNILWNSPDVWIRNTNDEEEEHENPLYHPTESKYVYVRVRNRGCQTSSGEDELTVYWTKATTSASYPNSWNGSSTFSNGALQGNIIGTVTIPELEAGEETILELEWNNMPNPANYTNLEPGIDLGGKWHFCLLAIIDSDDDSTNYYTSNLVKNNNNVAQKNITIIEPSSGRISGTVAVGNPTNSTKSFNLNFLADDTETGTLIFEEAEVRITLNSTLLTAWERGGRQRNNIVQIGSNVLRVTGDNASLNNLILNSNETGTLNLKFNFLTQEVTEKEKYVYHVFQRYASNNEIAGGETYEIRKDPRVLFFAETENNIQADKNETVILSAETINEPASYNWYDSEGNLVYEGADFTTSVEIAKTYKLEIIALADGYKDYSEVEVSLKPNVITTLYPNPTSNQVTISYKINQGDSAYLSVTGFYGSNVSNNYILDIEENEVTLDVTTYPQGLYSVALIVNGQIQETTTLIKQ